MFENSIKVCFYENAESEGLVYVSPFGETRYFLVLIYTWVCHHGRSDLDVKNSNCTLIKITTF